MKAAFERSTRSTPPSVQAAPLAARSPSADSSRNLQTHLTWALPVAALILALGILGGQLIRKGKAQRLEQRAKSAADNLAELSNARAELSQLRQTLTDKHPRVQALLRRIDALEQRANETQTTPATPQPAELEFRLVAAEDDIRTPADELADPNDRTGQTKLRVLKEVLLDSSAVASAELGTNQADVKELSVVLKDAAARSFREITAANIGRRLAIVWRGRILSAPVIRTKISGPAISVTGNMSDAEIRVLLDLLRYRPGKMPQ